MPTLTEVTGTHQLTREWRAAVVILTTAFPRDREVWACVSPGESIDLVPVLMDSTRPLRDRTLLAVAQSLVDDTMRVQMRAIRELDDPRLRLVLDALAIARGSLPVD